MYRTVRRRQEKRRGGDLIHTRWSIKINQNSENFIWQTKYSMRRRKAKQRQANVGFLRSTQTSGDLKILYSSMSDDFYFIFFLISFQTYSPNIFVCSYSFTLHPTARISWLLETPCTARRDAEERPCWLNCVTSMLTTLLKGVSLVLNLFYLWAVINYSLAPLQNVFFLKCL